MILMVHRPFRSGFAARRTPVHLRRQGNGIDNGT
jgi:hypothetical protein